MADPGYRSVSWERRSQIESIRDDVWRHLSQATQHEREIELETAALLQMSPASVRSIGLVQFLVSEAVKRLLEQMPMLIRRLATTTRRDEEWSAERIRGPISWSATLGA